MNKLLRYILLAITLCLALVAVPSAFAKSAGHPGSKGVHHARQVTHHAYGRGGRYGHNKHHRRVRKHHKRAASGASFHLSIHN